MFIKKGRKETVENAFLKFAIELKRFFVGSMNFEKVFFFLVN